VPDAAARPALLQGRSLGAAAAVCLGLAGLLMAAAGARCALGLRHSVELDCQLRGTVSGSLSVALMLWLLWLAASLTQAWLPRRLRARNAALVLQVAGLTAVATQLNRLLLAVGPPHDGLQSLDAYTLQVLLTFATCIALGVDYRQRAHVGEADVQALRRREQEQAAQLDAARAALLQAQVEPHFLFNTLAHLRRLARTDAGAARAMLADLRRYLDAALPELRQAQTPLARELELVRAFLALHQRRIGPERLVLHEDIAPGLDDVILPSTCLLTLAENAIKHGIAPQVDGGEIWLRAGPDPDEPGLLRLEVADTGAGMGESSGSGTGLATLRARLAAAHGPAARLSLHLNQPRGLIARIQLPRVPGAPRPGARTWP
jgi:signal transduction histidine kinase